MMDAMQLIVLQVLYKSLFDWIILTETNRLLTA